MGRRVRVIVREVTAHRLHLWEGTERDPSNRPGIQRGWAQAACDCGWYSLVDRKQDMGVRARPARSLALDAYAAHLLG